MWLLHSSRRPHHLNWEIMQQTGQRRQYSILKLSSFIRVCSCSTHAMNAITIQFCLYVNFVWHTIYSNSVSNPWTLAVRYNIRSEKKNNTRVKYNIYAFQIPIENKWTLLCDAGSCCAECKDFITIKFPSVCECYQLIIGHLADEERKHFTPRSQTLLIQYCIYFPINSINFPATQ